MSTRDRKPEPDLVRDGAAVGLVYPRIELENGSFAVLEEGIVHLYLADSSELFSVDANTVQFEKKFLVALAQVFLIGVQRGRASELSNVRSKLSQIINLVFN